MSDVLKQRKTFEGGLRVRQVLGLGAAGLVLGGVAGGYYFTHHQTNTEIAATEVGITPNLAGIVHIQPGIVSDMRVPIDSRIGIDVEVGNTTIPGDGMTSEITARLAATYGGVGTNPDAELEQVREIVKDQAITAGIIGGVGALLPTVGYMIIGERRRRELIDKGVAAMAGTAICATASIGTVVTADATPPAPEEWVPIQSVVSVAATLPEFDNVEVRSNAMTGLTRELVAGAIKTYEKSRPFYEDLEETARNTSVEFRQPEDSEFVALVISDRHDNIAMDPVLRATADAAGASLVINLGDDTSSGKSWEAFSLRSFTENFSDMTRIAVGGNHDNGDFVIQYLNETGSITPNGEVQEVEGITIAMENDPRKSDYTPEKREGEVPYATATEELADLACSEEGGVDVVLTHSASMGQEALARGCTDLVIGGHAHSYKPPELVVAEDGHVGYTVTNGTSGGAIFSFALGTSLKREANALTVTFASDGTPIGIQNVRYLSNGSASPDEYIPLYTELDDDSSEESKGDTVDTPVKSAPKANN